MIRRAVLAVVLAAACQDGSEPAAAPELSVDFAGHDGVVATEHDNHDPVLELTSGSLLLEDEHGTTDSAVFRARTRRDDFGDVVVELDVRNDGLEPSADAHDYDGISIGVRYQDEDELYYVNVHRRDGTVAIKRKDGTYTTLATATRAVPYGEWETVTVSVRTVGDGAVEIALAVDGDEVLSAVDTDDPILDPGRVLVRGDNCDFVFDDLRVTPA